MTEKLAEARDARRLKYLMSKYPNPDQWAPPFIEAEVGEVAGTVAITVFDAMPKAIHRREGRRYTISSEAALHLAQQLKTAASGKSVFFSGLHRHMEQL